jgi:hypothetical protein
MGFTRALSGNWMISILSGLCMDSAVLQGITYAVQNPCGISVRTRGWSFTYVKNGFNVVTNVATHLTLDAPNERPDSRAQLIESSPSHPPTQGQLWLFRPAYFRGNDSSLQ